MMKQLAQLVGCALALSSSVTALLPAALPQRQSVKHTAWVGVPAPSTGRRAAPCAQRKTRDEPPWRNPVPLQRARGRYCGPHLRMSDSGGSPGQPWIARGIQRLIRGRPNEPRAAPGSPGTLPSLKAVMDAVHETDRMKDLLNTALPSHPNIRFGALPNGLRYIILPNASPPERFEAHLEVFAGSSDELESQQGMAHLVEHIAYMGSRKRERLFGTGSQTNAYTDFHHTVFYASCPVLTPPGWGRRTGMLPRALEALCDVLEAKCEASRLEKERAAVLSEMSMVNTID
ncbi:unnamed protein product, partial [Phaeothamnion confervicola]